MNIGDIITPTPEQAKSIKDFLDNINLAESGFRMSVQELHRANSDFDKQINKMFPELAGHRTSVKHDGTEIRINL